MFLIKKILILFFFLLSIPNSFGATVTLVHTTQFNDGPSPGGIEFNKDGTKMFIVHYTKDTGDDYEAIYEYDLSTPFDSSESSRTYTGDSERCVLGDGTNGIDTNNNAVLYDLEFSSDGMKLFTSSRINGDGTNVDIVYRFDLTSPYDVSTCSYVMETTDLETDANINGSKAGTFDLEATPDKSNDHRLQALEINDDGTKLFLAWMDLVSTNTRLLEYNLTTPYDITTLQLVTNAGILIGSGTTTDVINPAGMRFSANGKRIFVVSHQSGSQGVSQISLTNAYDTSSFVLDGKYSLNGSNNQPRGIGFSANGLKMYVGSDTSGGYGTTRIYEYDLVCPFNIIQGKCPPISENSNEAGVAEAQIELARKTIEYSTKTALNRLKWIRRNKDKQNLTNQNIKFNFSNQMLASLTEALKVSTLKNKENKNQDVFYWSEGSISMGRVGDTNISLSKEIKTNSITIGADKFIDDNAIQGVAFRYGKDEVDVGSEGSNVDMDAYNVMLYYSIPKTETKYLDTIIGVGRLRTDITTAYDGKKSAGDRFGTQLYGTVKIKDEIKKDNLTLIPSGQIDLGYTLLNSYIESGPSAKNFDKQGIQSKNVKLAIAAVDKLLTEKYTLKRHGKLEYKADLHRSSSLKYSYVSDGTKIDTKLQTGALHNINGEIGFDLIFSDNYSVFVIYERSHAFGSGYTDQIHIALGYLPYKDTEYAFLLTGSENLMSQFKINKKINGYDISFNLNDDLSNLGNNREASINLNKVF